MRLFGRQPDIGKIGDFHNLFLSSVISLFWDNPNMGLYVTTKWLFLIRLMPKSIHKEPYKLLCSLLTSRRKALGISQYGLAQRLNRPQSFVAKVERYERRIDVIEFIDIANALEIDPCEILRAIQTSYLKSTKGTGE